ncbi:DUF1206 domain-containing protein [Roseivivax sp. GX 12232]|uniref:DUF1206 domain-containing protein n=1 Tax=Roseivivax sp. GX 12232 TaxID=2900547 RepID=UPI001E471D42|nr:DUF1206 domain-containing protein [Roseivivax sp. GX 12232]MCE0504912.1 DUF1206 domain-containing protein [Roseivivax sp. GX 12232]
MPQDTAPAWVVPVMRAGFSARAVVYALVGGLALTAALTGGAAEGTTNALAELRRAPFGSAALWAVALGLLAYALWRFLAAWYDLERRGGDGSGLFERGGLVVTGAIHAGLGLSVLGLARGGSGSGGGGAAQDWTVQILTLPYGPWIVAAIGLGTIGAGLYYMQKGWRQTYKRHIRVAPLTRKLDPALQAGFLAQGALIAIIGALIISAGFTTSPENAGGIGAALGELRAAPFGRILLGVVALGLLGFALENLVEAKYRIVPARAGPDVQTLASRAKAEARRQAAKAS